MKAKTFDLQDIVGTTTGKLTVKQFVETKGSYPLVHYYLCECECGNQVTVTRSNILSHTKSCGCLKRKSGQDNVGWKGHGEISSSFWTHIKHGANSRAREIEFLITIEEAWALFVKQDRRCSLTGLELSLNSKKQKKGSKLRMTTASLDRIDSNKGYTIDNVQWVHRDVNIMKQAFSQDRFIEICKLVTLKNTSLC